VTPGGLLRYVLRRLGWSQKTLALVLGRPVQMVCEIANGKKRITASTAKELHAATGFDARSWLRCDMEQQLRLAKPPTLRAIRARARRAR
jgi:plasmid maintenance system antidote protein VapI